MSQEREVFMTMGTWGVRTCSWTVLFVSLLGPVLAWGQVLTLTPSLTIGERYDDNIFQRSGKVDEFGETAREEDDYVTTISPAVQLRYFPRPETELTLEYEPAWQLFAKHSNQNYISHRLGLDFASPLSRRLSLQVSEDLLITEDPGDRDAEGTIIDPAESNERRQRSIRNTANISLNVGLTPRTSLGLLFENLIEDVEDNRDLDEIRYVLGTELGYLTDVARQNRVFLTYTASLFTFSDNCDAQEQAAGICAPRRNSDDFTVHAATVGYERNLSATLTARAAIGYATTMSDRDDLDGNDAFVGSIGVSKTLRTGQLALNYERNFTSGGGTADEVISDRLTGSLRFQPTPKITAILSGSLAFLDFKQANVSASNDDDRTFYTIRPSIEYQMLRFLSLNAAYNLAVVDLWEGERADRVDHRFSAGAVLAIRAGLFVELAYEFRTRILDSTVGDNRENDEFSRNEVFLRMTYRPTFRF